jgi:hypothetical protein
MSFFNFFYSSLQLNPSYYALDYALRDYALRDSALRIFSFNDEFPVKN